MLFKNDQWTISDGLGFKPAGEQLSKLILLAEPPFAAGVNGKWGSGKTSLMRYAMARLGGLPVQSFLPAQPEALKEYAGGNDWNALFEDGWKDLTKDTEFADVGVEDSPIRCAWFNPWQYQYDPNPLIPLLHEVRSQFSNWVKTQMAAKKLVPVTVESGLELLAQLTDSALGLVKAPSGFKGFIGKIRSRGERYEADNLEVPTDAQRFNLLFEKAVKLLLGDATGDKNIGRLVVFIDGLLA